MLYFTFVCRDRQEPMFLSQNVAAKGSPKSAKCVNWLFNHFQRYVIFVSEYLSDSSIPVRSWKNRHSVQINGWNKLNRFLQFQCRTFQLVKSQQAAFQTCNRLTVHHASAIWCAEQSVLRPRRHGNIEAERKPAFLLTCTSGENVATVFPIHFQYSSYVGRRRIRRLAMCR